MIGYNIVEQVGKLGDRGDSPVYEILYVVLGIREVGRGTWNLV